MSVQPRDRAHGVSDFMTRVELRLRHRRFDLSDEKRLQAEIFVALEPLVCAGWSVEREVKLARGSVIDLLARVPDKWGGWRIGVEVKRRAGRSAITNQLLRYINTGALDGLVVITSTAVTLPYDLAGVPVRVISLGEAYL